MRMILCIILGQLGGLGVCVGGLEAHGDPSGAMKDIQERERSHFTEPARRPSQGENHRFLHSFGEGFRALLGYMSIKTY